MRSLHRSTRASSLFRTYQHDLYLLECSSDASLLLGRLAVAIESHGRQFMAVRWSSRPIQRSLYSAITHFHLKQSRRPPIRHFRHRYCSYKFGCAQIRVGVCARVYKHTTPDPPCAMMLFRKWRNPRERGTRSMSVRGNATNGNTIVRACTRREKAHCVREFGHGRSPLAFRAMI